MLEPIDRRMHRACQAHVESQLLAHLPSRGGEVALIGFDTDTRRSAENNGLAATAHDEAKQQDTALAI